MVALWFCTFPKDRFNLLKVMFHFDCDSRCIWVLTSFRLPSAHSRSALLLSSICGVLDSISACLVISHLGFGVPPTPCLVILTWFVIGPLLLRQPWGRINKTSIPSYFPTFLLISVTWIILQLEQRTTLCPNFVIIAWSYSYLAEIR